MIVNITKEDCFELMKKVPQTYGEAIQLYPWLTCESHEWDNRKTIENAIWLISHLSNCKLLRGCVLYNLGGHNKGCDYY